MRTRGLALLLALLGLGAVPAAALDGTMALGAGGEIVRVLVGTYGSLIPDAPAEQAANSALVLERAAPGAAPVRMLVPGTDSPAVERFPSLTVDASTDSVFMVWEARASIHSTLHLVAYQGGSWTSVVALSDDAFSEKINPRVAATRDTYRVLDSEGNAVDRTRVVLHLVWFDRGGEGDRPMYAPLVIEDGVFVMDWEVIDLQAYVEESAPASAASSLPAGILENPVVETSRDGAGAIFAFGSSLSGRIATVESRPISAGLISWSDAARHQILDTGRTLTNRRAIVDKARHQILDTGRRLLSTDAADLLTAKFLEAVASSDPAESLEAVVAKARHQILDTGARLDSSGTRRSTQAKSMVSIGEAGAAGGTSHIATLAVTATWTAPALPGRAIRMLPSGDGGELAVAWDLDGTVKYRMSQPEGWSEVRSLVLGAELSRDRAYELIARRVDRR